MRPCFTPTEKKLQNYCFLYLNLQQFGGQIVWQMLPNWTITSISRIYSSHNFILSSFIFVSVIPKFWNISNYILWLCYWFWFWNTFIYYILNKKIDTNFNGPVEEFQCYSFWYLYSPQSKSRCDDKEMTTRLMGLL